MLSSKNSWYGMMYEMEIKTKLQHNFKKIFIFLRERGGNQGLQKAPSRLFPLVIVTENENQVVNDGWKEGT